jgi:hypothetical protein
MAAGMNWGILSLLAMIILVLGGVGGFFIFLARRSASMAPQAYLPSSEPKAMGAEAKELSADDHHLVHRSAAARFPFVRAWRRRGCSSSRARRGRGDVFVRADN